ncbi:MAG: polymer-forming cytoskeletal protein [Salinivirgaceae bacterium]|jgi:cytoskeletal protein CcmA (bactofilin family)
MAKTIETEQKQINIIGAGTSITGDINCSGDIRIDGNLTGNLFVQGKVIIGGSGTIKGEISCKNSEVEGKIEGKISVGELLSLKTTSSILGDIKTRKLAIEPGAQFTGNCTMNHSSDTSRQTVVNEEAKK